MQDRDSDAFSTSSGRRVNPNEGNGFIGEILQLKTCDCPPPIYVIKNKTQFKENSTLPIAEFVYS